MNTNATYFVEVLDFINYARVLWDNLGFKRKQNIPRELEKTFWHCLDKKIHPSPFNEAIIIGTDPSVNKIFDHELDGRLAIAQYNEFVDYRYSKHQTFDILRRKITDSRFIQSTANSVDVVTKAEKKLATLTPSNTIQINQ